MKDVSSLLLRLLAILSLVLVALGSLVRTTGAGLSCPDWPLCFGQIVPTLREGVLQEYVHRVVAAAAGLLTVAFVISQHRSDRTNVTLRRFSLCLLALIVVQAVFGALTVVLQLSPLVVTAHLVLGTFFLQLVALAAYPKPIPAAEVEPRSVRMLLGLGLLLCVQIMLGGLTASSGAALTCPYFPYCPALLANDGILPLRLMVLSHGTLGLAVLGVSAFLFFTQRQALRSLLGFSPWLFLALVCLQALVGLAIIHAQLPSALVIIHAIIAQAILFFSLRSAVPFKATEAAYASPVHI